MLPAILSGVEAIYYGGKTGLSGDDYTGLLALAAAPVLLVGGRLGRSGRSRRLDDHRARRYGRRLLKTAGVLVAAAIVVLPLALTYIGSHVARADVPAAKLGAAHEDVKLHTSDGLELDGWYVPSRNRAAVIVFPGRAGTRKQARMLVRNGYGVLLYDRRGEGRSEGDPNGWGWDFDKDIRAGLDFLKQRADVDPERIGGLGLSVGGEMMLQTAAETDGSRRRRLRGRGLAFDGARRSTTSPASRRSTTARDIRGARPRELRPPEQAAAGEPR